MKSSDRRAYHSPLREAQARETRERILASVATWIQQDPPSPFTLEAVAQHAGLERRTVFRHFSTKETLLEAFWAWVNDRVAPDAFPPTLDALIAAPRETFAKFDEEEGLIRASLHTLAGRAMRQRTISARRQAFRELLDGACDGTDVAERQNLEAVAHLLYSAAAWETMRDYAGLTGAQAGEAASWALRVLAQQTCSPAEPRQIPSTQEKIR